MRDLCIVSILAVALCGCATNGEQSGGARDEEPSGAAASAPTTMEDGTPVLQVRMTDQTTDGRVMLMRGKLVNPHAQPVQGVRLLLAWTMPAADGGYRITDVQRREMETTIPAGGSTMFRWDVESQSNAGSGRLLLVAIPKRLGDRDVPPPPEWTGEQPLQ